MRKAFCMIFCLATFAGCAYDVPVFVTIETSETAFNIKLEGEADQATLKSEEYLRENMISTKRVQITYRWVSQGYWVCNGKYLPNERIIVVDRAPETREWVVDPKRGTSQRDEGIWVESSDSVGFSTGYQHYCPHCQRGRCRAISLQLSAQEQSQGGGSQSLQGRLCSGRSPACRHHGRRSENEDPGSVRRKGRPNTI